MFVIVREKLFGDYYLCWLVKFGLNLDLILERKNGIKIDGIMYIIILLVKLIKVLFFL